MEMETPDVGQMQMHGNGDGNGEEGAAEQKVDQGDDSAAASSNMPHTREGATAFEKQMTMEAASSLNTPTHPSKQHKQSASSANIKGSEKKKKSVMLALESAFDMYDKDNSGAIDNAEFKDLCSTLGRPLTDTEVDQAMRVLDLNNNGKVDKGEFISWWARQHPSAIQEKKGDPFADAGNGNLKLKLGQIQRAGIYDAVKQFLLDRRYRQTDHEISVLRLEEERARVQKSVMLLQESYDFVDSQLQDHKKERRKINRKLDEVETAYSQILEATTSLFGVMQEHDKLLD